MKIVDIVKHYRKKKSKLDLVKHTFNSEEKEQYIKFITLVNLHIKNIEECLDASQIKYDVDYQYIEVPPMLKRFIF